MEHRPEAPPDVEMPDLSPLALRRTGDHLEFILRTSGNMLVELPADYEELLANRLARLLREDAPLTAAVNLQDRTAVSSRELGALIALSKVLRPRFGLVAVVQLSDSVRRLFAMTHIDRLFAQN